MIRIILVDDEHLIRSAIAGLLGLMDDIDVAGEFESGEEALKLAPALEPTLAIVDLQLGGMDGIDTAIALMDKVPGLKTMILTSHARPGYLKRALSSGISGFLPKTAMAQDLEKAVRDVARGSRVVDPGLAADTIAAGDSPLTPRETDVVELAAHGAPIADIARRAHLAEGTVRNYLSSAQLKLGAKNRHEAVDIARAKGWLG
ncbi:MAG: response regulator transcription factor [Flaviflexus sp.]|uniref:Response regulator transcription factor n=1 Tax=Flaviflexus ciconiae TaxID=2496867 RepID=A0A3S9PVC4_9ACTO|nr:response regulator transcription factor [Flaviflexus ciconiae]AZQ76262.1 response regulator transcription factor [Flaviflexus ciconiae]